MEIIQTVNEVFDTCDAVGQRISQLVANNVKTIATYKDLMNNLEHLQQVLKKGYVINDGRSLASYENAVTSAKQFMGLD